MAFRSGTWIRRTKGGKEVQGKARQVAKCDGCSRNIKITPRYKRVGDLEYRYFSCRRCGAVYIVSVTDETLRQEVKRYQGIMERFQTAAIPPEISQEAQLVLKNNVQRSRELKEKYPLELKPWER
ncbi:MAG: hypothetical protein NC331_13980 [Lachnospiraceae bacterium]|nr:hypothetical protein [Lachnospiraceae bacterium]MCM1240473.1 hypothetical protein [Lachnospiraceae bacterium]